MVEQETAGQQFSYTLKSFTNGMIYYSTLNSRNFCEPLVTLLSRQLR